MTKENLTKKWLSVCLYVICTVSVGIIIIMIMNWSVWNVQTKLFASVTALLPIHVLEEWHFSGGFFVLNRFNTIFGYIPIAVGIVMVFVTMQTPTAMEIIIGLSCSVILGAFSLKIVEKICMNENSSYLFTWGSEYFGKYVDE